MGKRFIGCDFSHSEFDACLLRNCVFDSCDFVGAKFKGTNLRGTRFECCRFDYAEFSNTHLEAHILETNCPERENILQKFARSLRVNFQQIGDSDAANRAILVELDATRVHLKKAWHSKHPYYRKKYHGIHRALMFLDWAKFEALHYFWGNGESLFKLLRSIIFLLIIISACDVFLLRDYNKVGNYISALAASPQVLLGVVKPEQYGGLVLAAIASARYILFACLVSVFIKRLSRR
ncbi:MAG: pentapeptide repeat-containing protein [Halofilum sp. (in: g-proteobacteria)]